ncbi:MAG: hypothetical protein QOF07_2723, partial [Bradyrhizobium sp.]|nr:hypothetical protein [Bradyrhizobium sp.]
ALVGPVAAAVAGPGEPNAEQSAPVVTSNAATSAREPILRHTVAMASSEAHRGHRCIEKRLFGGEQWGNGRSSARTP